MFKSVFLILLQSILFFRFSMKGNNKVIVFVITVSTIYFTLSFFSKEISSYVPSFKNVELFADISTTKEASVVPEKINIKQSLVSVVDSTFTQMEDYNKADEISDFDNETKSIALHKLAQKLYDLSQNKKTKIRIAWLGDSQIEGDLITQDIRKMLQEHFGNKKGVGFLPINCVSSDLRATSSTKLVGDFTPNHFKKNPENSIFLSGYSYFSSNLDITFKDRIKKDSTQVTEKWLLFGKGENIKITQNGEEKDYPALDYFNRVLLDKSTSSSISFSAKFPKTPVYGVSFEPESGIVLDNFSFRGITGVELKKVQQELLEKINNDNYYDLVVFQYGVNMMFRAKDTNYDYYHKIMTPVISNFKNKLSKSEILIFSCSDRAFNYDGEWKSAIGIDSLIKTQARIAYENKVPFYNLFSSMGGKGVMKKWCDTVPKLANKDYIHFNPRGSREVAKVIFKCLIKEFNKAINDRKHKIEIELKNAKTKEKSNA